MPRFIVQLKNGARYAVEATSYCAKQAMLGLTHPDHGDVAAFPFTTVEAIYREDLGEPLPPSAPAAPFPGAEAVAG